ncbi:hypothetical protein [Paramagnetospirillum kuznetsovii]|uniref:hypothetical protein n=1 Tax=Paramagnetospirillum kuznetsovii TaxID=2053833 RepID=UPI0011BEA550|nr:hypothetical protein [Paramagnetospirillum kuznetsovii]
MVKKSKSYPFEYLDSRIIIFQNKPTNDGGKAKWSFRVTIPPHKPIERRISDYFEYNPKHYARASESFPYESEPTPEIIAYAKRILFAYREEVSRTGRLPYDQPKLVTIVETYVSGTDLELLMRKIDPNRSEPEAMFVRLNQVTYVSMKKWTESFGDNEPRVRAIIKAALIKALSDELIPGIPPIFT